MNKLQKRALRKKRHERQQYLKHQAPLDSLEQALLNLSPSRCRVAVAYLGSDRFIRCKLHDGHDGDHVGT